MLISDEEDQNVGMAIDQMLSLPQTSEFRNVSYIFVKGATVDEIKNVNARFACRGSG